MKTGPILPNSGIERNELLEAAPQEPEQERGLEAGQAAAASAVALLGSRGGGRRRSGVGGGIHGIGAPVVLREVVEGIPVGVPRCVLGQIAEVGHLPGVGEAVTVGF